MTAAQVEIIHVLDAEHSLKKFQELPGIAELLRSNSAAHKIHWSEIGKYVLNIGKYDCHPAPHCAYEHGLWVILEKRFVDHNQCVLNSRKSIRGGELPLVFKCRPHNYASTNIYCGGSTKSYLCLYNHPIWL